MLLQLRTRLREVEELLGLVEPEVDPRALDLQRRERAAGMRGSDSSDRGKRGSG